MHITGKGRCFAPAHRFHARMEHVLVFGVSDPYIPQFLTRQERGPKIIKPSGLKIAGVGGESTGGFKYAAQPKVVKGAG